MQAWPTRGVACDEPRGAPMIELVEHMGSSSGPGPSGGPVEEALLASKDVDAVVGTVARAGIARPVARLRPFGVIKG